jgi:6-phosphofructokinase 1
MYNYEDFLVERLGNVTIPSPLQLSKLSDDGVFNYLSDDERVIFKSTVDYYNECREHNIEPVSFEKSGPKEFIYFDPVKTKAAIVTCGGLCPGLNNVIRGLVIQLYNRYGVKRIVGIRYGYEGFIPKFKHEIVELDPDAVEDIQTQGGSILGTSRGPQNPVEIVDALERMNINILFTVGGDGTLRGAQAISEEIKNRGLKISIAAVPKTIDNDINFIEKSFGFETAFSTATEILQNAHNEAKGAFNGIALVKLMGRDSGFIAANATLAVQEVNFAIIPEMDFILEGPQGFLEVLYQRLENKRHALIAVAEGAGQNLFGSESNNNIDASGNVKFHDIGLLLKDKITQYLNEKEMPFTIKYIDPSYIIRSSAANANDSIFCNLLAQNAVHGAMAGRTNFVVGYWNSHFTLLPIQQAVSKRKMISTESELWSNVLETTGQPKRFK